MARYSTQMLLVKCLIFTACSSFVFKVGNSQDQGIVSNDRFAVGVSDRFNGQAQPALDVNEVADSRSSRSIVDSMASLVDASTTAGRNLVETIQSAKTSVETALTNETQRASVGKVISAISTALPNLQSGEGTKIASGCLDILAGIAGEIDKLARFSPILSILSMVIGLFTPTKVKESVGQAAERVLRMLSDQDLQEALHGVKREYEISKAFLDGVRKETSQLTASEVAAVAANIPVYQGVRFIGMVVQRIERTKPKTSAEAERLMALMELLADLISYRDIIIYDMYQMVLATGNSPNIAAGIQRVKNIDRNDYKRVIDKKMKNDDMDNFFFLSYLLPRQGSEQLKKIYKFFDLIKVDPISRADEDISGDKNIVTLRFPTFRACPKDRQDYLVSFCRMGAQWNDESKIRFRKLSNGYYTIKGKRSGNLRSCYSDGNYVRMSTSHAGDNRQFNLIPVKVDGKDCYLITNKAYPGKFAYTSSQRAGMYTFVDGAPREGDVGSLGYFVITDAA